MNLSKNWLDSLTPSDWWPLPTDQLTQLNDIKSRLLLQGQNVVHSSEQKFYQSLFTEWSRDKVNADYKITCTTDQATPVTPHNENEMCDIVFDDDVSEGQLGSVCISTSHNVALCENQAEYRPRSNPDTEQMSAKELSESDIATKFFEYIETDNMTKQNFDDKFGSLTDQQQSSVCGLLSKRITLEGIEYLCCYLFDKCSYESIVLRLIDEIIIPKLLSVENPSAAVKFTWQILPLFEEIAVRSLVLPLLSRGHLQADSNLLAKITRHITSAAMAETVLIAFFGEQDNELLTEENMNTIDKLLRFHQIIENQQILQKISNLAAKSSPSFSRNARFGKFLLSLVKKLPPPISVKVQDDFMAAANAHATFLKKNIELELKKKIAQASLM